MHQLKSTLRLPISLDRAWDFFSSPKKLAVVTPEELNLVPTPELPGEMYPGMFIEYTVRPLLGIPAKWVTEITHVQDKKFFVDEQRLGPCSKVSSASLQTPSNSNYLQKQTGPY